MTEPRRRRRSGALGAGTVAAALALSGCAAIPTSGPVFQGDTVVQGYNAPGCERGDPWRATTR